MIRFNDVGLCQDDGGHARGGLADGPSSYKRAQGRARPKERATDDLLRVVYRRPEWHAAHGRIPAGRRLVAVEIAEDLDRGELLLSACLADRIAAEPEMLKRLLKEAGDGCSRASASFDEENHCIRAQAHVACADPRRGVLQASPTDLEEFVALLRDDRLQLALQQCQGRVFGTPIDVFDGVDPDQEQPSPQKGA